MNNIKQQMANLLWRVGVQLANKTQRIGLGSQKFRAILRKFGHLIIPLPKEEYHFSLPFGLKMISPPDIQQIRSYAAGIYEEELTNLFKDIVKEGMTIVDIGALLGYYTLLAFAKVGDSGKVYAFEPESKSYSYLLRNIEINSCNNVLAVNKAVSDKSGSCFFISSSSLSKGPIGGIMVEDSSVPGTIEVQTTSLDDFFEEQDWPSVDLIKMDIDGAEKFALKGMKQLCSRNPQMQLIMEFDPESIKRTNNTPEILANILSKDLGFRNGYIIERKMEPFSVEDGFPMKSTSYNTLLKR